MKNDSKIIKICGEICACALGLAVVAVIVMGIVKLGVVMFG